MIALEVFHTEVLNHVIVIMLEKLRELEDLGRYFRVFETIINKVLISHLLEGDTMLHSIHIPMPKFVSAELPNNKKKIHQKWRRSELSVLLRMYVECSISP